MPQDMGSNILDSRRKTGVIECYSHGRIGHMGFTIAVWEEVLLVSMSLP
jgi:hypothetical protein